MKTGTTRSVERVWLVVHGQKSMRMRNIKNAGTEEEAERLYRHYESLGQHVDVFMQVTTTETYTEKLTPEEQ